MMSIHPLPFPQVKGIPPSLLPGELTNPAHCCHSRTTQIVASGNHKQVDSAIMMLTNYSVEWHTYSNNYLLINIVVECHTIVMRLMMIRFVAIVVCTLHNYN